jgi:hypothetical protein
MNYGVDRYKRPSPLSMAEEKRRQREREAYLQSQVNDLWRTVPVGVARGRAAECEEQIVPRRAAGEPALFHREERPAAGALAARDRAHRAQDRAVLLSAAPDPGHERGLGDLLALHPAEPPLREGYGRRRLHDGGAAVAHQRRLPAGFDSPYYAASTPTRWALR